MSEQPIADSVDLFFSQAEESELLEQTETEAVAEKPAEELESPEAEAVEAEATEELEESDASALDDGEEELVYLELDGEEVDLDTVRAGLQASKDAKSMQSDYTQKTQAAAAEMKKAKAQIQETEDLKASLLDMQAELQALIQEDEAVNWDDLRVEDPEEYIRRQEVAAKRKAAIDKIKAESAPKGPTQDDLAVEEKAMFDAHPNWITDKGELTDDYKADVKMIGDYWASEGYTAQEQAGMMTAKQIETSLKAAKYDALQEKAKTITSKAKKATLMTKPKQRATVKTKTIDEYFYKTG